MPSTEPGHKDNQSHAYGLMLLNLSVPLSANPGSYTVAVQGQDAVSGAAVPTIVPAETVQGLRRVCL